MKRLRFEGDHEEITSVDMANVLMLLARGTNGLNVSQVDGQSKVFECKTCNRIFGSFQALGGHRASHKKPKLALDHDDNQSLVADNKPKVHECSICGVEFALGQALGGHMRRHRATMNEGLVEKKTNTIGKKRVMLFGFELPIHG